MTIDYTYRPTITGGEDPVVSELRRLVSDQAAEINRLRVEVQRLTAKVQASPYNEWKFADEPKPFDGADVDFYERPGF